MELLKKVIFRIMIEYFRGGNFENANASVYVQKVLHDLDGVIQTL